MWSYGVGCNADFNCPENGIVPTLINDQDNEMNQSLHNFLVGDQIDLNDELGTVGFTINSSGLATQSAGCWMISFYFAFTSVTSIGTPVLMQGGWDDHLAMTVATSGYAIGPTYTNTFLFRKRTRSSGTDYAYAGLSAFAGSIPYDFIGVIITPINEETFELLFARGNWATEPPALLKGKGNKFLLPKPKAKPTKTERLASKSERPSDVGSTVGPTVGGKVAVFDFDTHTVPNTGSMEDGVRSTDQFVGLTTEEIEDFLKKKRAKEQRQMAKVQEQIDSADVVRNLQKKIDRVNNQLKFAEMQPRLEFRQQVETHVKAKPEYPLAVAQANTQS
jgi:hypothetical protein